MDVRLKSLIYRCENHSQGVTVGNINFKKNSEYSKSKPKKVFPSCGNMLYISVH